MWCITIPMAGTAATMMRQMSKIPRLEDLSLWVRMAIAIITILLAIVIVLLMSAQAQIVLTLPPTKWDAEMLELERRALQEAYVEKIKQLFNVWVSGGLDDPQRP